MPSGSKLRVYVHLNYGEDVRDWPRRQREGLVRDPSPYGFAYAADEVDFVFSQDRPENKVGRFVRDGAKFVLGFDLLHALRNTHRMRGADAIWAHTEKEHLPIALLKVVGLVRRSTPVVANSIWVWGWYDGSSRLRRWFTRSLLRTNAVNAVGAVDGATIGSRALGRDVVLLPFGTEPFLPLPPRPTSGRPRIVAPGNDKDRDWKLLGEVAKRRPDWDFLVLSRRARAKRLEVLPNVEVTTAKGMPGMEKELSRSDVLVIPCHDNPHASGATTVMQALTAQRPVVVTGVGGIELYGGDDAFYAALGDVDSFISATEAALERSQDVDWLAQARQRVHDRGLDEQTHARRHLLATRDVLAGRPVRAAVSETRRLESEV